MNRRELIRNAAAAAAFATLNPSWISAQTTGGQAALPDLHVDPKDPWASLPDLLARIKAPVFPNRDFLVKAKSGTDATTAIRKAIDSCVKAGGGRVVIPAGDYLTGPIHLKSRVNLHVSKGATLRFSQDPSKY